MLDNIKILKNNLIYNSRLKITFHVTPAMVTATDRQVFSQGPERGRPILVQRYIYSKERGGGGGGVKKPFLWKTFEF
jgi:hypothetical protein